MDVKALQTALKAAGFDPKGIDGVPGRDTIAAVKAFQGARKLPVKFPGTVGPITLEALGLNSHTASLPWIDEARRFLGTVEGTKSLDRALGLRSASIPWCGAFVAMVIATVLPKEPLPINPLWAQNWLKFGTKLDDVYFGAIATFKRPAGGHVGFVVGHDKSYLHILGGNQSNKVSVVKVAKSRCLGYTWPKKFTPPKDKLAMSKFTGKISTNEA